MSKSPPTKQVLTEKFAQKQGAASCTPSKTPLNGTIIIPGDKSISHRALMLGAIAIGETRISGLLEGDDVLATAKAMRAFGAEVEKQTDGTWSVRGIGLGNFISPEADVDFENAGTGCRLVMGLMTASPCRARFIGDASLSKRPMQRVLTPLKKMGLAVEPIEQDHLPLTLTAPQRPIPISYKLPVASAQVKSAILLAGLGAPGETHIIEPHPTRDHTERMLTLFGADIRTQGLEDGHHVWVKGEKQLTAQDIIVPGDPSSAAFPMIAALMVQGSEIQLNNVMMNQHRDGLFRALAQMGAHITSQNLRQAAGEDVVDLKIQAGKLKAIELQADIAPSMIDEYPALAMLAACAEGTSIFHGLGELRVKESDRLSAIIEGLKANGVEAYAQGDSLIIHGLNIAENGQIQGGGIVKTHHDHRIAMSFLLLGLVTQTPVVVDNIAMIATSFPNFFELMADLGVTFQSAIQP